MTKKRTAKIRTFEGLPVKDADASMVLHVVPNDIKGADKKNPAMCAAARAGKRELGTDVRVFLTRTYVKQKNHWVRFLTPESASREIVSFDRGASFEPGEYKFNPAPPGSRLGMHRGSSEKSGATGTRKPRKTHATAMVRERSRYDSSSKARSTRRAGGG